MRLVEATLAGDDVVLRPMGADDWPLLLLMSADADVVAWTTMPADLGEDRARLNAGRAAERASAGEVVRFVVESAGVAVGTAGAGVAPDGTIEIFYALLPAGRGRGVATRAVGLICGWLAGLGAASAALDTIEGNTASERVAERAGFRRVGSKGRVVKDVDHTVTVWERALGPGGDHCGYTATTSPTGLPPPSTGGTGTSG